jgi:hypothetical protein
MKPQTYYKMVYSYKQGKESDDIERTRDALVDYIFDKVNSLIFRRGMRSIQIYKL